MKVTIGSDHAGFLLKEALVKKLTADGVDVLDVGTHNSDPVDYPDFAKKVADAIVGDRRSRLLLRYHDELAALHREIEPVEDHGGGRHEHAQPGDLDHRACGAGVVQRGRKPSRSTAWRTGS